MASDTKTLRSAPSKWAGGDIVALVWACLALLVSLALVALGVYWLQSLIGLLDRDLVAPRLILGVLVLGAGGVVLVRYVRLFRTVLGAQTRGDPVEIRDARGQLRALWRIDLLQLFLLAVMAVMVFPLLWIVSMSLDPRDFSRPTGLTIIPPGATLRAYVKVLTHPSPNPVTFPRLLLNSLLVSGGTSVIAVVIGTSAGYAFSRLSFPGRRLGMLGFVLVLMIPASATLAPLFVLLNALRIRTTLWGLAIAYASSALPFSIWNMKGFIDSLPYDLEEAAQIDGCTRTQGFVRVIVPLAVPGMAVTALTSFLTGWSEYILAWTFLTDPSRFTLPMVLRGMIGQYASGTPWSEFAAMSIVMSIPAVLLFFFLQRYLVSGLAAGGVKG